MDKIKLCALVRAHLFEQYMTYDINVYFFRYDDGLVEVIGLYSSFHVAQLQVGISEPVRLGQAKEVKLELLEHLPVQVDGEPWEQAPATLHITFHCQAAVLVNQGEPQS